MDLPNSKDARSLELVDTQRRLTAVRLDSSRAARLTLTRTSAQNAARETALDADDLDSQWLSSDAGSRLSTGELVPGTRFKIIRWIGEGGMGQVFEAVHVDIQRLVALKVLKSSLGITPDLCATFLAEARACAKIESRFVVSVLDFGVLPDDRPFFAMELLAQDNLHTELLATGWMSLERVIPILRQICKALAAIHKAGLVHRDLKPENVIIQPEDGRADTVRVVDFGIAAEPGAETRVAGTPTYMAPEQIRGQDFDARLDIYALGCMAYEMLSGGPPFEGSLFEVFEAQLEREAPPISKRRDGLPPELDAVLLKCVEKASEDRWANVHELEAALCEIQILAGFITPWDDLAMPEIDESARESLVARMPRATAQPADPSRSRWWIGIGLGALAIGLIVGMWLRRGDDGREQPGPVDPVADAPVDTHIDELSDAVRLAASRAYWVYPPIADPDQPTALSWIRELEAEEGALAEEAQARAVELRTEIAATLVRFGDKYWEHEHGRSFAVEYYALALIFMPTEPRALERSSITPAQLADVIARAQRGEFTAAELRAAEVMTMLADEDHERMHDRVVALIEDDDTILSVQTRESLIEVAQPTDNADVDAASADTEGPGDETGIESGAEAGEEDTSSAEEVRSPAKAAALAKRAEKALKRGDRNQAEQLFNEAISHDNRSVAALSGLAGLHFDAGEYGTALSYARKASRLRPKDGDLHVFVGDCYLKVLRYSSARAAYQKAADLDHPRAAERISYLDGLTR